MPAVIIGGVLAFVGLDELPIGYAEYASTTQVLLGVFVASQAPVLFSRDLRHGTIALYLARPLRSSTYAVARWASLLGATLVFLVLPIVILYAVALLAELDVSEQTRDAAVALGLAVLLGLSLAGVAGLIASWSTRRGFAVVATIAAARHRQRRRHGHPGHRRRRGRPGSARSPGCSRRTRSTAG